MPALCTTRTGERERSYQRSLTAQQRYYRAHREELNAKRRTYRAKAEASDRRQVRVAKNAAHLGGLHQALTTFGYSRCVPPPVPGRIAMMLLYGDSAAGARL